jgi:hypothetical protein
MGRFRDFIFLKKVSILEPSRAVSWAWRLTRMRNMTNARKILIANLIEREKTQNTLASLDNSIKMDL